MENIVIAGGTSGMGLSAAKLLVNKGYQVTILGRNTDKLNKALAEIGQNATGKSVDATNSDSLKQTMAEIGQIDHLVIALAEEKELGFLKTWT